MKPFQIRNWIITEFKPNTLAIGAEVIDQQVDNAIRYFNTHSAYTITKMFDVNAGQVVLDLSTDISAVSRVYPSTMQEELFSNHPMWVLLGFITLDRFTTDLIQLSHAFEGYRVYLGTDFKWKFLKSDDPTEAPKLFLENIPRGSSKLAVVGLKRIVADTDITEEFLLDWLLRYTKALVKINEGNVLRKAAMIGISNDGDDMMREGMDEKSELQKELRQSSRWSLLGKRG